MRLGDLDYAQKQLTIAEVECGKNFQTDCNHVRDFLNALPTIDAVPVVRCRDCKHRKTGKCPNTDYTYQGGRFDYTKDDGYCSYGERKDGDCREG